MRAFVKYGRGPGEAELRDVTVPDPGPGRALVRVAGCGVCGSDLHAVRAAPGYEWTVTPVILGHEFAGTVVSVGDGVSTVAEGDLVVAVSVQGCGECRVCLRAGEQLCPDRRVIGVQYDGGLAEYAIVPARHLVPVPPGVDAVTAALTEPLSVAIHAVLDRAHIGPGDRVVVSGPGAVGLLCSAVALRSGASVLALGIDADLARRLPAAAELGAETAAVDGTDTSDLVEGFSPGGVDAWIEASGAVPALADALEGVRRGGTVTVVGVFADRFTFFPTDAVRGELDMAFSYASARPHYQRALELLADGAFDTDAIVDRYPLAATADALEAAASGDAVKPLIVPGDESGGTS